MIVAWSATNETVLAPKLLSLCCKRMVHAFSCVYIKLRMQFGSLESTLESEVALQTSCMHP